MTPGELMVEIDRMIEEVGAAILATVGKDGEPHMRWMTPAILRERPGVVFAVTSASFGKVKDIEENQSVQWIFQTKTLNRIITLNGYINLIDNSSIRSEVLEAIGNKLRVFWNYNEDERDLLVLETIVRNATFSLPMKGFKEEINLEI